MAMTITAGVGIATRKVAWTRPGDAMMVGGGLEATVQGYERELDNVGVGATAEQFAHTLAARRGE